MNITYPNDYSTITLTSLSKVDKKVSRVIDVMKRFCYSKVKSEYLMKYKLQPKLGYYNINMYVYKYLDRYLW